MAPSEDKSNTSADHEDTKPPEDDTTMADAASYSRLFTPTNDTHHEIVAIMKKLPANFDVMTFYNTTPVKNKTQTTNTGKDDEDENEVELEQDRDATGESQSDQPATTETIEKRQPTLKELIKMGHKEVSTNHCFCVGTVR